MIVNKSVIITTTDLCDRDLFFELNISNTLFKIIGINITNIIGKVYDIYLPGKYNNGSNTFADIKAKIKAIINDPNRIKYLLLFIISIINT